MKHKVKLSSKYQIVIPKEARKSMHLEAGDKLVIEGSGNKLVLWKPPKDYADYMAGLHKEVWRGTKVGKYISSLRREWEKAPK
jgi:AbrB family looped-hinge helix DNA binding protein